MFFLILRPAVVKHVGRKQWKTKIDPKSKKLFDDVSVFEIIHFNIFFGCFASIKKQSQKNF